MRTPSLVEKSREHRQQQESFGQLLWETRSDGEGGVAVGKDRCVKFVLGLSGSSLCLLPPSPPRNLSAEYLPHAGLGRKSHNYHNLTSDDEALLPLFFPPRQPLPCLTLSRLSPVKTTMVLL